MMARLLLLLLLLLCYLGDGEAAEGEGGACDALAGDVVDLVDHLDAVHLQARLGGGVWVGRVGGVVGWVVMRGVGVGRVGSEVVGRLVEPR